MYVSENDNLRQEYATLFHDVPADIAFARIALEKEADAINLWIGNDRSVTSLHKDNYENLYGQIRGRKHFVLLPPIEMPCVNERLLPRARYKPIEGSLSTSSDELAINVEDDDEWLPIPTWDPDDPGGRPSAYSHLSQPLRVTLEEGDLLYLPAMWYHKVRQTAGDEGFACAVNYWYDMDFSGGFWTANSFLRDVAIV
jgi:jumonji domain-containing protein 7